VKKVLKFGYVMVRVDCYEEDPQGSDWFCHHVTSPNIFRCGFSQKNNITLTPPYGYDKNTFNWNDYFNDTKTSPAQLIFSDQEVLEHNLKEGMKLEAADLMDPRLICVATIGRVVGSLLKIHFDGWEEEYDQWLDASSPDVYPVGYCELVGHKLEKPPQAIVPKKNLKAAKKGRKKTTTKRQLTTASSESPVEKKAKETKPSTLQVPKTSARSSTLSKETSKIPQLQKIPEIKPKSATAARSGSTEMPNLLPPKLKRESSSTGGQSESKEKKATVQKNEATTAADMSDSSEVDDTPAATGEGPTIAIPKLINSSFFNADMPEVDPDSWSIQDVGMFLKVNDCGTYCESFEHNKLDGPKLLALTKDQIIVLTKMKVGPAVKILDFICHLRRIANHARTRKENNKNKVPVQT